MTALIYHGTPMTPRAALLDVGKGRAFCISFFHPQDVAVMLEMSDPEVVRPARTLADDLGVDVKAVRATQRRLRDLGLARDGSLWSYDDGLLCGRGTWLLRLGLIIREGLAEIIPSEFRRVIE